MTLTEDQKRKLNELWFVFGNGGPKSTMGNHRFIQDLLTQGTDNRRFYSNAKVLRERGVEVEKYVLTQECFSAVDEVIKHHSGTKKRHRARQP